MQEPTPSRHRSHPYFLTVNPVPIDHTAIRRDIHLRSPEPSASLPNIATSPESQDDWQSQLRLEKRLCGRGIASNGV